MLRRSLAALAALTIASISAGTGFTQPAPVVRIEESRSTRKAQRSATVRGSWYRHTYLNHGPNAAQVQRAARKARNVKRHRRHARG